MYSAEMTTVGVSPCYSVSSDKDVDLIDHQHALVRLIQKKREYTNKLKQEYSSLNSYSMDDARMSDDLRENLDRLKADIMQAEDIFSKYQAQLQELREELMTKRQDGFLNNAKTIEIRLCNGECIITASEDLTIKEACQKSNRFTDINFSKSRMEFYVTIKNHVKETRYVNWADPSIKYANCKLYFKTNDQEYLKKVAPGTHNLRVHKKFHKCMICHNFSMITMHKCSTCKLKICNHCEKNLTIFCTQSEEPDHVPEPSEFKPNLWLIEKSEILDWLPVGEGTWGVVYRAYWHGKVAVKKLKCKNPGSEQIREFESEVSILRQLRHDQIVLFMAYILDPPDDMCIVMHWCESSLYKRIHVKKNEITLKQALRISREIAQGMEYLHSRQIVHRDLKSSNIFLTSEDDAENSVKIGDFGLAKSKKTISRSGNASSPTGSLYWMAPEILSSGQSSPNPYTHYADAYAFGVVLFELFSGELPYSERNFLAPEVLIYMVGRGHMCPDLSRLNPKSSGPQCGSKTCPKRMKQFIEQCTRFDALSRPIFHVRANSKNKSILSILKDMGNGEETESGFTDGWRINPEDVTEHQVVGEGTWGIVYKAKWHGPVAVKKIKCKNPSQTQIKEFENEVAILRQLRHKNIVLFMSYILNPPSDMCIVMHWCSSSLYKRIHVRKEEITMKEAIRISKETAQGMEYLHSKNIVHRDLKSSNIFLQCDNSDAENSVKIGDFGLAVTKKTSAKGGNVSNAPTGSLFWMAPEILNIRQNSDANPYTIYSDMYAYGVVLYELFAGELPYSNQAFLQPEILIYMVGSGRLRPDINRLNLKSVGGATGMTRDLIISCIEYEASKRPTFDERNSSTKSVLVSLQYIEKLITNIENRYQNGPNFGQIRKSNSLSNLNSDLHTKSQTSLVALN